MDMLTLQYRHNTNPHRGLAASGIIFLKVLLAIPHLLVLSALASLTNLLAYIGYWIVAFTGEMPQAVHRLLEINYGWNARAFAWLFGIVDVYPPFETDPPFPAAFEVPKPENPSKGWALAGLLLIPKALAVLPHAIVLIFLAIAAVLAAWFGYIVTALTGRFPEAIQDFLAGVMQWVLRVTAWFSGLTDEYPPFSLDARPQS